MYRRAVLSILLGLFMASSETGWAASPRSLVGSDSLWRYYKGRSEPSPGDLSAWRQLAFNDSTWDSGTGAFYYGEPLSGTYLGDMGGFYSTIYLRRTFVLPDLADVRTLAFTAICDDGFVAWINGHKIAESLPPAGELTHDALAQSGATEPVQYLPYTLPPWTDYLVPGTNILAVQVFNVSIASSDIVFDALLSAEIVDRDEPTLAEVLPPPGPVTNLNSVTVTFSEPVLGVDAADLLVNGIPASAATINSTWATFTFTAQEPGPVTLSWDMNAGIVDTATPPHPFNPNGPTAVWTYTVIDPSEPNISTLAPPAGETVRQLSQVEVTFDRPVTGVDAADLLIGGAPANSLLALSASAYLFRFDPAGPGDITFAWTPNHAIHDLSPKPKPFNGASWTIHVDPAQPPPQVRINEILAEASRGYLDEDGQAEDWIELYNAGTNAIDLGGWSLTDDPDLPGQWVFPPTLLGPGRYLVVFASAKNRRPDHNAGLLHTNFKLGLAGEYLGLYDAGNPRTVVSELRPGYPEQRVDFAYGVGQAGTFRYLAAPTPGRANEDSALTGLVEPVHFSVERGVFRRAFQLALATPTPGAEIRYTTDGGVPTPNKGLLYTGPFDVTHTATIRAAAFKNGSLPSHVTSHSYIFTTRFQPVLPILSITTDPTNLFGPKGIMETNPRNTTQYGLAWERPVSVELIHADGTKGFHIDAGLRVHGGGYVRGQYDPNGPLPFSKYSFRLYFRGDYGTGQLDYPLFPGSPVTRFDSIVLRAGMNDHSNPYLRDEFARRLLADTGQVSSHGTFCTLFINGVLKGYYNPAEHIGENFLQSWRGGGDDYDLLAAFGGINEGDAVAWNDLLRYVNDNDPAAPEAFEEIERRLDLVNFADYLLCNIYADTDDWPHNNWRVGRERIPNDPFRFYMWDAEWSFGYSHDVSWNTVANQLSSLTPPWGSAEIARLFLRLSRSPEFRLVMADRAHRHFFNQGALTDARIRARYEQTRAEIVRAIANFDDSIGTLWIPRRRNYVLSHLASAGLLASTEAPTFTPHGGPLAPGASIEVQTTAPGATLYYTTNGEDPRLRHSGTPNPNASALASPTAIVLPHSATLKARTLHNGTWSALTEASFNLGSSGSPLRISEIMYNPPGGDAYEYLELFNPSTDTLDLAGWQFTGVSFVFPKGAQLGPNQRLLLASGLNPAAFASRYPGATVHAYFTGNLPNSGGRIALLDASLRTVLSVDYDDQDGWPAAADGGGPSLELADVNGDPDAPATWRASAAAGGSPGTPNPTPAPPSIRLNEILAENAGSVVNGNTHPDFIELHNPGQTPINLAGWSVTDDGNPRKFVLPANTLLAAGGFLVLWCDAPNPAPGLHTGFALGRKGETLSLFNAQTSLVDHLTFGLQVTNRSLGRVDSDARWTLTDPSPGSLNEPALVGDPSDLVLNELVSNPAPGGSDWVELHNRNATRPVALTGMEFSTSTALFQIRSLSFIEPNGYTQLFADEKPGADHLDFKLPAAGGVLSLSSPGGQPLTQLAFPALKEGVAFGRWPDAVGDFIVLNGVPSPGAPNYQLAYQGPILNELMAWNSRAATNANGQVADWVELFNPGPAAASLTGMALAIDGADPWPFPSGVSIPAGGYLVLWCDPDHPPSTNSTPPLQIGRGLDREHGALRLLNTAGQVVDQVQFGFQIEDRSLGLDAGAWTLLNLPTPGRPNSTAAALGSISNLCLNEWETGAENGPDWFELHNRDASPVGLAGCSVTDDPSLAGTTNTVLAPLSFIDAHGWVRFIADAQPSQGVHHTAFKLDPLGETLRIYSPSGTILDSVHYLVQPGQGSQGRFPDGAASLADFPTTPSPAAANHLPIPGLVINEVLAHTDPPLEDAIELRNLTGSSIDIGGFYLSNSSRDVRKYRIPPGTVIPPYGYWVFYESQFNPSPGAPASFTLNSAHGDTVCLSATDAAGELTGYRLEVTFDATENAVSLGRFLTSLGATFVPLSKRTFGKDNLVPLEQFRTGTGLPNAYPAVGPVVISELMYHPVTRMGTNLVENEWEEYVELHNLSPSSVPLFDPAHPTNHWRLQGGIRFDFPATHLPAGGRILVLSFDPATNLTALANFRARYNPDPSVPLVGPYLGKLNNDGDRLALFKPDRPQEAPHPDAGFVPYVLVEEIDYSDLAPWPAAADGQGQSLQRRVPADFGNDPVNWLSGAPTPGAPNTTPDGIDTDNDGISDTWEQLYGFDPTNAADAELDPDGDGMSNLAEFIAGTHPRDAGSRLELQILPGAGDGVRLRFTGVVGQVYDLQQRESLEGSDWETLETHTPIGTGPVELTPPAQAGITRYFRLQVRRIPIASHLGLGYTH